MSADPHVLNVITPNDDGTFTCKSYEFDSVTKERKQIGEERKFRRATESDREAHARDELAGKTLTAYAPEDFQPFLLVQVEET